MDMETLVSLNVLAEAAAVTFEDSAVGGMNSITTLSFYEEMKRWYWETMKRWWKEVEVKKKEQKLSEMEALMNFPSAKEDREQGIKQQLVQWKQPPVQVHRDKLWTDKRQRREGSGDTGQFCSGEIEQT